MFAYSKANADRDLGGISALSTTCGFFWATMYYNAGAGTAADRLRANGTEYCSVPWTHADDVGTYQRNPEYNALWRTATLDYLTRRVTF